MQTPQRLDELVIAKSIVKVGLIIRPLRLMQNGRSHFSDSGCGAAFHDFGIGIVGIKEVPNPAHCAPQQLQWPSEQAPWLLQVSIYQCGYHERKARCVCSDAEADHFRRIHLVAVPVTSSR